MAGQRALEECARIVDVAVAAPDEDGGGRLAEAEPVDERAHPIGWAVGDRPRSGFHQDVRGYGRGRTEPARRRPAHLVQFRRHDQDDRRAPRRRRARVRGALRQRSSSSRSRPASRSSGVRARRAHGAAGADSAVAARHLEADRDRRRDEARHGLAERARRARRRPRGRSAALAATPQSRIGLPVTFSEQSVWRLVDGLAQSAYRAPRNAALIGAGPTRTAR